MATKLTIQLDPMQTGLTVGVFCGVLHTVWAIAVSLGGGQSVIDWVFPMHFLSAAYTVLPFSALTAVLLVLMASFGGFVLGGLFAALWNLFGKKVR